MKKNYAFSLLGAFIFLIAIPGYSQWSLLKDINPGTVSNSSSFPSNLVNANGSLIFSATHPVSGTELWKSDGTDGGTVLIKDINTNSSSTPTLMTNVNGIIYFVADDGEHGKELWKSDGTTAGTVLVKDIRAGSASTNLSKFTNVNGVLFFAANDGTSTYLWKSDGTAAGTVIVSQQVSSPDYLVNVNGVVYFSGSSSSGTELWKSDGTSAGTVVVKDIFPGSGNSAPSELTNVNGTVFFRAYNSLNTGEGVELWKSDGTADGTVMVKDIQPGPVSGDPRRFYSFSNTLYFSANDGTNGYELWKSDGTAAGTVMVKDIAPAGNDGGPYGFVTLNGSLYFIAKPAYYSILFKTDGTAAGTVQVSTIAGGEISSPLVVMNGNIYFEGYNVTDRRTLWKSDGTLAGTAMLKDLNTVPSGYDYYFSNISSLTAVGNTIFFGGYDVGQRQWELWKSDGTTGGTGMVTEINKQGDSEVGSFSSGGNNVYFQANDGMTGFELWQTDGTTAGTSLVADINPNGNSSPWGVIQVNPTTIYFVAYDDVYGGELFKMEGTSAPVRVKDINPGAGHGVVNGIINVGNVVYFVGNDGSNGDELWRSDGTSSGTYAISDLSGGSIGNLKVVNTTIFFSASHGTFGSELWKSDGTLGGTAMVKDINTTLNTGSSISGLMNMNGTLFFSANDGTHQSELWKSDGTEAGTMLVADINTAGSGTSYLQSIVYKNKLYFRAQTSDKGDELWVTDGTTAGTVMVKDLYAGIASSSPQNFIVVNDVLYFMAFITFSDASLFKTDGTAEGTVMLKNSFRIDLASGSFGQTLYAVRNTLYVLATDNTILKTEIWRSDGDQVCRVVSQSNVYAAYSYALGNKIYIGGNSYQYGGRELFVYDATSDISCKKEQTITFTELPVGKRANDIPFTVTGTASSGLPLSFTSSNTSVATISGNTITLIAAGETDITATQVGDATFLPAAPVVRKLVVDVILGIETSAVKIASVYPNPFVGGFVLRVESSQNNNAHVSFFTAAGDCTEVHENLKANTDHVLGSSWPPGFYIAHIKMGGKLYTRKIVKQ